MTLRPGYPEGSNAGLPRSTCVTEWVRSLLLYRRPFCPRRVRMEHPFQPQSRSLPASLTPSFLLILREVPICEPYPSPEPRAASMLAEISSPRGFDTRLATVGYIVRGLLDESLP